MQEELYNWHGNMLASMHLCHQLPCGYFFLKSFFLNIRIRMWAVRLVSDASTSFDFPARNLLSACPHVFPEIKKDSILQNFYVVSSHANTYTHAHTTCKMLLNMEFISYPLLFLYTTGFFV